MKTILMLLVATTLVACSTSRKLTVLGTTATIEMTDRERFEAELITMQDGSLVVFADSLRVLPDSRVRSVRLGLDQKRGDWIVPVVFFEVLPMLVFLNHDGDKEFMTGGAIVGVAIIGATTAAFVLTEPPSYFTWPPPASELPALMPHFRHPYGLTPEQIDRMRSTPLFVVPPP